MSTSAAYPSFASLTTPVESIADSLPDLRTSASPRLRAPMPTLAEPEVMPLARHDEHDVLQAVATLPGVSDLNAYRAVGLAGATSQSVLRFGAAKRLGAAAVLLPQRYGLAVFDAWRPLSLQRTLYDLAYADPTLPPGFVSLPSLDPTTPPPHLTGGTVDVTLTFDGQALALGTDFDDFTDAAHADAFEQVPGLIRDHRRLLFNVMRAAGFVVIACEWWHFEFGTRRWAALTGSEPRYQQAYPSAEDLAS